MCDCWVVALRAAACGIEGSRGLPESNTSTDEDHKVSIVSRSASAQVQSVREHAAHCEGMVTQSRAASACSGELASGAAQRNGYSGVAGKVCARVHACVHAWGRVCACRFVSVGSLAVRSVSRSSTCLQSSHARTCDVCRCRVSVRTRRPSLAWPGNGAPPPAAPRRLRGQSSSGASCGIEGRGVPIACTDKAVPSSAFGGQSGGHRCRRVAQPVPGPTPQETTTGLGVMRREGGESDGRQK